MFLLKRFIYTFERVTETEEKTREHSLYSCQVGMMARIEPDWSLEFGPGLSGG